MKPAFLNYYEYFFPSIDLFFKQKIIARRIL